MLWHILKHVLKACRNLELTILQSKLFSWPAFQYDSFTDQQQFSDVWVVDHRLQQEITSQTTSSSKRTTADAKARRFDLPAALYQV